MTEERQANDRALWVIGCGYVGRWVLRASAKQGYRRVFGTTRSAEHMDAIRALGATPVQLTGDRGVPGTSELAGADVVVTYPSDPARDGALVEACEAARAIVYISSTAVYGSQRGRIDDRSPIAPDDPVGEARSQAESRFLQAGATVLRAPGIYGPERGLHIRLSEGRFRFTGQGDNHISRIHVEDLSGLCFAALQRGERGQAHVVGDHDPCTQREAVAFLCQRLGLPLPGSQPAAAAHRTLRGDRMVDPAMALERLGYTLRFPSYREGFLDAVDRTSAMPTPRPG